MGVGISEELRKLGPETKYNIVFQIALNNNEPFMIDSPVKYGTFCAGVSVVRFEYLLPNLRLVKGKTAKLRHF